MAADHTIQESEPEPILRVRGLSKQYGQRHWFKRQKFLIQALKDVEFAIHAGSTLALVGESGAGKSTLARCLARLEDPDSGEIWYRDKNLLAIPAQEMRWVRQQIQLIFQDPTSALNPRFSAVEIVAEPLAIQRQSTKGERRRRALEAMEQVGLSRDCGNKSPLELSGGQRQRLALARALVLEPKFLILDEALAGLDLSIQAQIVNLLLELQISHGLTYLYISHDLTMVGRIADQVAVMRDGRIIEWSQTSDFFTSPRHPYTQELIASIPRIESRA
jgi:peptide/nickel transport system ATP-binding protein